MSNLSPLGFVTLDADDQPINPFHTTVTTQLPLEHYEYGLGYSAFVNDEPRDVPNDITHDKEWLRGWDSAKFDSLHTTY